MPTGFDKFKEKTLSESPITINTVKREDGAGTPESRQVMRMTRASRVGETERARREEPEIPAVQQEKAEDEKLFQLTIKIRPSTKEKLDWLKFTQKKKLMELAEEAFEDIYNKYKK